jgi:hypothetical protein
MSDDSSRAKQNLITVVVAIHSILSSDEFAARKNEIGYVIHAIRKNEIGYIRYSDSYFGIRDRDGDCSSISISEIQ